MTRAWTLMTAMPPTKGHFNLMNFVSYLGDERGRVIVATQPGEPLPDKRFLAVRNAAARTNGADVVWVNRTLPQDPNTDGFWEMWRRIMYGEGFKRGDIFVSSEPYGAKLAEVCEGVFMPYDIERELLPTRATDIRNKPVANFSKIMPEFQQYLRLNVCFWGAESTGKTTLAKEVSALMGGHFLYEYARPYLEAVGPEITVDSMHAIWYGQEAAEKHANRWYDKPYLFKDTDLYSTIGYWEQPHWTDALGPVPPKLRTHALMNKADLYIIPMSNIPFEQDPIRYGGDHRESPDDYWIALAEKCNLNYVLLDDPDFHKRVGKSMWEVKKAAEKKMSVLSYERQFNSAGEPIRLKVK